MDIVFDSGSKDQPKGHALLYFKSRSDPEELWATYLVVLPIPVDVRKYVPPFLMNQVGEIGPKELSAFAFPPAPEKVDGYEYLAELAGSRGDDILFGGTINPSDVASALMSVNETVQWYADVYGQVAGTREATGPVSEEGRAAIGVNDVLYGLMSDGDKLSELTKLVGRLRFSSEGGEEALMREAEDDILVLASHLPEKHHVPQLIDAAKAGDSRGTRLADLYLRRCFHLIQEEYVKLGQVEAEIKALEDDGLSG